MAKISISTKRVLAIALIGSGSLTLLFWAKLRLMTQVPRAAYAEPDAATPADPPAISPDQSDEPARVDSPELVDAQDDSGA